LLSFDGVGCFVEVVGEGDAFTGFVEVDVVTFCWVCIRVFTTSSGVVITPAMPPALAAVAISRGKPMVFEP
jgi:hypothetical protein